MNKIRERIEKIAQKYDLQVIYAFGSRAKEVLRMVEEKIKRLSFESSDLDIGIKPRNVLTVEKKVEIALAFEDVFDVPKVDIIILQDAPVFLALEIVTGELLYAEDSNLEAEYQLYIMRKAAELIPYERMRQKMILEV
ncbi:MAG: hypothetical protein SCARUB_00492 [Candidatus Scalindua rubra]|uniref:Polymerase beta nucleotidyltransferase domain-containing protein n=1 Tax=Candidatus Scalindua rubra TaxID=1872076 RepID=A0A1E3XFF6_9BACT|nr:MAG: hypothetical protein SCARUB_00492 [Candidatus Scalindua rubra]